MKYNKIALVGMMGSGKSLISKLLSEKLNYDLYELDEIFENEHLITIKEFFKKYGENIFRSEEYDILKRTSKKENIIISCGGGTVLKKECQKILFEEDIYTIYLKTSPNTIYERIKNDTTRPLLQVNNPKEEIEKILNSRENLYKLANLTIETDNKTKNQILEEIIEKLWKK